MTQPTLPNVPLRTVAPDGARRARLIMSAIANTPPDGAPSAYYEQVAKAFEEWAEEEEREGNAERAATLRSDAAIWRARAR